VSESLLQLYSCASRVLWTTRLNDPNNSWTGVALVERMPEDETVTSIASKQMKKIDAQDKAK